MRNGCSISHQKSKQLQSREDNRELVTLCLWLVKCHQLGSGNSLSLAECPLCREVAFATSPVSPMLLQAPVTCPISKKPGHGNSTGTPPGKEKTEELSSEESLEVPHKASPLLCGDFIQL